MIRGNKGGKNEKGSHEPQGGKGQTTLTTDGGKSLSFPSFPLFMTRKEIAKVDSVITALSLLFH